MALTAPNQTQTAQGPRRGSEERLPLNRDDDYLLLKANQKTRMDTIPATKPLTHNSAFVLNMARHIYGSDAFLDFLNDPRRFERFLNNCILELKIKGEFFCQDEKQFMLHIPNQIMEWAALNLSADSVIAEEASPHKPTPTMNPKYSDQPVANVTLVFGTDVSTMSASDCLGAIKGNNSAAKALTDTGITGPYVEEQLNRYAAANEVLLKRLNSFATPTA
jgi:hypothetical protein